MPQVSKRFLDQKTQNKIFDLFISGFILTNSKDIAISFIDDLFTPTEKTMLSKRFSIAYMLLKGYDYDLICDVLKVSRSTVGYISSWLKLKGAGFRKIISKIRNKEGFKKLLDEVEDTVDDFVASQRGQNWSQSKSWLYRRRLERKSPF